MTTIGRPSAKMLQSMQHPHTLLPSTVIGYTSPYPTVVIVAMTKYIEVGIDVKPRQAGQPHVGQFLQSTCASYSNM